jgi:hypothetical protein
VDNARALDVKVILETDWGLLKECVEDDAEAFFKLNNDPQVLRSIPDSGCSNNHEQLMG